MENARPCVRYGGEDLIARQPAGSDSLVAKPDLPGSRTRHGSISLSVSIARFRLIVNGSGINDDLVAVTAAHR